MQIPNKLKLSNKISMKKLLFIIIVLFLLPSCTNEYIDFHKDKQVYEESIVNTEENLEEFSLEDIKIFDDIRIEKNPNLELLEEINKMISNAKEKIYLEMYILTEKTIQESLKEAHNKWLEIKIILEKNVYMAPWMNKNAYENLTKAGVDVVWSDTEEYSLDHTKMAIIDDEVIISTGNFSYSSFKSNREFLIFLKDDDLREKLEKIFLNDFYGKYEIIYDTNLILSPHYTREKFYKLLESATENIDIYAQNISDRDFLEKIIQKDSEWIDVRIILPPIKDLESNSEEIEMMRSGWIEVIEVSKPYIHAKSLIIDNEIIYVWSINFSYYSIDENKEIWLIIKNPEIVEFLINSFEEDYASIIEN